MSKHIHGVRAAERARRLHFVAMQPPSYALIPASSPRRRLRGIPQSALCASAQPSPEPMLVSGMRLVPDDASEGVIDGWAQSFEDQVRSHFGPIRRPDTADCCVGRMCIAI